MSARAPGRLSTSLPLGSLPVHAISPVGRGPQSHSLGCSDRDPEPSTPRRGPVAYTHRPLGGLPACPSQSAPSPAPGSDLLRGPQSRVHRHGPHGARIGSFGVSSLHPVRRLVLLVLSPERLWCQPRFILPAATTPHHPAPVCVAAGGKRLTRPLAPGRPCCGQSIPE